MACPHCGCKVTYQFDDSGDDEPDTNGNMERCAACGRVFELDDAADDGEDG